MEPASLDAPLLNALGLCDETFGHSSQAGDHHQSYAGHTPSEVATSVFEMPSRNAQASHGNYRCDDIASPVHNVENGAFDGCCLLTLDGLAKHWGVAQILRNRCKRDEKIRKENRSQCKFQNKVLPVDFIGAMKNLVRG